MIVVGTQEYDGMDIWGIFNNKKEIIDAYKKEEKYDQYRILTFCKVEWWNGTTCGKSIFFNEFYKEFSEI